MSDKNLAPYVRIRELDANGNPLAGGKLYTYRTGTSTPKTTYSDASGTANANPIILDSEGSADVWIDSDEAYRFRLETSTGALRWQRDNITNSTWTTVRTVATIADLRLISGSSTDTSVVIVAGYYAVGDGGGGEFYWSAASTATDNGGSIIKATAVTTGRWLRVLSGSLSVKWFGAKGDGATNDSDAFHAAIAVVAANGGGQVDVPFGRGERYAVNITIADKRGIHLSGTSLVKQNPRTTTFTLTDCLVASDIAKPIITIGDDIGTNGDNQTSGIILSNIAFSGQGTAAIGLRLKGGAYRNFYNNLSFSGFTVAAISAAPAVGKTVFYQYFSGIGIHCTTVGALGISVDGSATGTPSTNVTSLYFDNGYIACMSDAASRCVYCYSAAISMSNMYLQLAGDGIGVELHQTAGLAIPKVSCSQVTIDGDSVKPAIYANIPGFDAAGGKDLSRYIFGSFTCDGSVKLHDATTNNMMIEKFGFTYKQLAYDTTVINAIYFANAVAPEYDSLYISVGGGATPTLTFTAPNGVNVTTHWRVDGAQVVGARITGWTAATGTATRTTFDTATVTTAQLAERVKALLDDLITHGLIGV